MAVTLVHSSLADFPLFDDEQSFFSMTGDRQDGAFNHFIHTNDPNFPQNYIDMNSMYHHQAQATPYNDTSSQYYHASNLVVNAPKGSVRNSAPQYTPSASPSTSMSHSGDQPSSVLSTASKASIQSNTSSAVGSPYTQGAHVLTGQEQWTKTTSGLGFEHDFGPSEGYTEIFPFNSSTESEASIYPTDRNFGACVGESQQVSSSISSSSVPVLSPSLSASPRYSSVYTASPSPSLALENSMEPRNTSIGTIMEEYVERNNQPYFAHPATLESQPAELFPSLPHDPREEKILEDKDLNFRQPDAPASATSPTVRRRISPFGARKVPERAHSRPGPDRPTIRKRSSNHHPYERRAAPTVSEGPGPKTFYPAPFFNQSSGRFVAPLESTCWFSLTCVLFFSSTPSDHFSFSLSFHSLLQ